LAYSENINDVYETSIFTEQITSLLDDESYKDLQNTLIAYTESGDLLKKSGGLRKMRWHLPGKGKSGGIRAIYYLVQKDEIFFIYAYPKNKQESLTDKQINILRSLVQTHLEND